MQRSHHRSAPFLSVLTALALGTAGVAPTHAQSGPATLTVRVVDDVGRPLAGAGVWVDDRSVATDASGRATLAGIKPGVHFVRVRADGYRAESVTLDFPAEARVEIEAQLQVVGELYELPTISVEAERQIPHLRRAGYYRRRQAGFGTFLERDQAATWDHLPDVTHLLRGVRGITVVWQGAGYVIRSSRGSIGLGARGSCVPQVVVDGMPWPASELNGLPASEVEAIEVYAGGATSPPQFAFSASGTSCGTVVIWRRRGGRAR